MNGFVFEKLTVERVDTSPDRVVLRFVGEATGDSMDRPLEAFMHQLASEAGTRGLALDLHLGGLLFCRSGFVTHLVALLEEARVKKLRIRLYFDRQRAWQRKQMSSFQTLANAIPGVEVLEEVANV